MAEFPTEVTERWAERTYVRGVRARRVMEVTGVADEDAAIEAAVVRDIAVGEEFPLDSSLIIPPDGIEVSRHGRVYVLTVDYRPEDGGSGSIDDRLAQKWRVISEPVVNEEPADRDGQNRPCVNSTRMPFSNPITRPVQSATVAMWRWESSFELAKHLAYANKRNSDNVTIPKLGTAAPGELLCECIKLKEEVAANAPIVPVLYIIRARPRFNTSNGMKHGFHRRVLDVGQLGKNADGVNPITFKTGRHKGKEVSFDVRLNGKGGPFDTASFDVSGKPAVDLAAPTDLDETSDGVFLLYDMTDGEIAFAGLNIAANI